MLSYKLNSEVSSLFVMDVEATLFPHSFDMSPKSAIPPDKHLKSICSLRDGYPICLPLSQNVVLEFPL